MILAVTLREKRRKKKEGERERMMHDTPKEIRVGEKRSDRKLIFYYAIFFFYG